MKRTALTLTLTLALLFSAMAGTLLGSLAMANPSPELDFPHAPITTPPTIVVHSPAQNQNYNSTEVLLYFTIIKPEAWVQRSGFYGASDKYGNKSYDILGNITAVYYVVDSGERQNISVLDAPALFDFHPKPLTLNFSISLILAKGTHNIKLGFEADSYYLNMTDSWNGDISSIAVNGSSEPIIFTVLQEHFPTTLVITASGASIVAVAVGILVYRKKRKHHRK